MLHCTVNLVALHIDGRERTGRAKILTGPASDTSLGVNSRHHQFLTVITFLPAAMVTAVSLQRHHLYGSCRTVTGAVAARLTVPDGDTVVLNPYGMAYMGRRLFRYIDGPDSPCRTDLRALGTLRTAISSLVGHLRLHQAHQVSGRTQHSVGADRHAELTAGAMPGKMSQAHGSRRNYRSLSVGYYLVLDDSQTAVHLPALGAASAE